MTHNPLSQTNWRDDFPAFQHFAQEHTTWLDSAATSQKPYAVIERLAHYYQQGAANIHRGQYPLAQTITAAFEEVRQQVAKLLNAASYETIIFTRSSTEAINLLAYGLEANLPKQGKIVVSGLEHHANLLPWQQLAKRNGLDFVILPITQEGIIDLEASKQIINETTQLVAISQMSNVFGTIQPIQALIKLAKQNNAISVIDGAQGIVHQLTDVQALDCDFYTFSGHKLYAPEGVGVLYGKPELLASLTPWQVGGEMVLTANYYEASFRAAPLGFEAGTPAIGSVLGLGAALDYLKGQDRVAIDQYEHTLLTYLLDELRQRPNLHILGNPTKALASFYISGIHPADLSHLLAEQNIAVRSGQHCCMPLYKELNLTGATRVSLALYNNLTDIKQFLIALDKAIALLT